MSLSHRHARLSYLHSHVSFFPKFSFSKKTRIPANISHYTTIILLLAVYRIFQFKNFPLSREIYLPEERTSLLFVYIRAGINSHIEFLRSCRGERKVLVKLGFFKANSISDGWGYKSRKPVTRLGRIPTRIIHIRYHSEAREEHLAKTSLAYWWLLSLLFPYTLCYPLSMQSQLYIKPCLLREIDLDCCKKKKSVHDELFNEFIRISKRCFINFSFSKKEIGFHWMRRNILLLIVS